MIHEGRPGRGDEALSLTFWGVRGSIPVCGEDRLAVGGHTPCIEVRLAGRTFVVDAGSGAMPLGYKLRDEGERDFDLLLTHLHHDHVMGLFFFKPIYLPETRLRIHCGNLGGASPEEPLRRLFSPPLFPISFEALPSKVSFHGFVGGDDLDLRGVTVRTCPLAHPSGATAYRFEAGGRAAAIVTDIETVAEAPSPLVTEFVRGCDLVVYDTMYTETEYPACKGWGHSTVDAAVALCRAAGVPRLAAFHHNPAHDDAMMAGIEAHLAAALPGSFLAREGRTVSLAARAAGRSGAPRGEARAAASPA